MRAVILERAAELLANSPTGDISTRAVCEAAGVTQPVLYRLFGDKDGLLAAVIDHVWEDYLAMKRAAVPSADALADLRSGWDNHASFALANPHAYRLLFGSRLATRPEAIGEALSLLQGILERLAAQGRLRMPPADAARIVMAANSGMALGLILRGESHPDPSISTEAREVALRGILVDVADSAEHGTVAAAATMLRSHAPRSGAFTPAEANLLDEWLARIQNPDASMVIGVAQNQETPR
jgi:AcrR family transcriptional regulator